MERKPAPQSASWNDVAEDVDEAIDQLPDDLRIPIIRHYLERCTQEEIARELDIFDTFEIDQIQRQRAAGDSAFDPLIGVGKYIGSDLYLKYAQGIRQDDRDFIVEYQINQHLLLQSEIRRRIDENQGASTYNLDLKYLFEY